MTTWLTPQQLADEYGITKRNQERLRSEKLIPFSKVGRLIRYHRDSIDKWLTEHKVA
jgi:excisionase family DNA binding protein